MRFKQFIEAMQSWAPGPAQQVPGYQQASPQSQQLIAGVQNSLNGLNDPMMRQTAQRAQMPMSQMMGDIKAQAQRDYPPPQYPTMQQTLQGAYNTGVDALSQIYNGDFERRRQQQQGQQQQGQQQQGQQQQGQQQQGQQQQGQQQQGQQQQGRCPSCGQPIQGNR